MLLEIAAKLSFALLMLGVGLGVLVALSTSWDDRRKAYSSRSKTRDEFYDEAPVQLDEIRKEGF
jgi:hypothetical protein